MPGLIARPAVLARPRGSSWPLTPREALRPTSVLQVETFVIRRDERSRKAAKHWDWLMAQIKTISWRSDVGISGDPGERLDRELSAESARPSRRKTNSSARDLAPQSQARQRPSVPASRSRRASGGEDP
jgi:hypothetical protein